MNFSQDNKHDEPESNKICCGCVGELYLKEIIGREGDQGFCSYCEEESETITIERLTNMIEAAFEAHYQRTPTEPDAFESAMLSDRESSYEWDRKGEPALWAIANAADITETAARDVLSVLQGRHYDRESAQMGEECPFDTGSHYEQKDPGCDDLSSKWMDFERSLKTEARYFSRSANTTLAEIFDRIETVHTLQGTPVVVSVGPDYDIKFAFRARVFAAEDEKLKEALKYPWKQLGPPPVQAATAGRMNARGISVFYGALDAETALAEVRPPVGSKVAIARFVISRSLRLLDVAALKAVVAKGSIFDPGYVRHVQRARFLEILSGSISRPVMPNEEALEYLPTQAVADYLATEARLDGVIFPSVQVGRASSNVVLFHHSSRVGEIELPKGIELSVHLEMQDSDGFSPDYRVWEEVPAALDTSVRTHSPDPLHFHLAVEDYKTLDTREVSLKIDIESVSVHHVRAVSFANEAFRVNRHRSTRVQS